MNGSGLLQAALDAQLITLADRHLARYVASLDDSVPEGLELLVALASAQVREGSVCLPLQDNPLLEELGVRVEPSELAASPLVGSPGQSAGKPLVLDGGRFYLARYHAWEQQVIAAVRRLLAAPPPAFDEKLLRKGLDSGFPRHEEGVDWQRVAAALALTRRFTVISGGPGTGKTWTVARILELLLEQPWAAGMRIVLAAPTGKAAGRLTESIGAANPALLEHTGKAQTLHRLLGMRPGRIDAAYGRDRPLPLDLLIVDEVSMVDLPMMARLLAALPEQAQLMLLGDRFQLASVEAGQVMADLCGDGEGSYSPETAVLLERLTGEPVPVSPGTLPPMADHLVILERSRRFDPERGIGRLAAAVKQGDGEATFDVLQAGEDPVVWMPADTASLQALLQERVIPLFRAIREASSPQEALERLGELRVLCAVRDGPQGVRLLNGLIERALGETRRDLYHGQPVMVTVNDYRQRLFNGDIGLVFREEGGALRVWFPDGERGVRSLLPGRLPPHESIYAMTIHKSQGSEFDEVILVLPEQESPLVTRELLYTGITRARSRVTLCASPSAIEKSVRQRVRRVGGLYQVLWQADG